MNMESLELLFKVMCIMPVPCIYVHELLSFAYVNKKYFKIEYYKISMKPKANMPSNIPDIECLSMRQVNFI